jgi:hypothetical protein
MLALKTFDEIAPEFGIQMLGVDDGFMDLKA